MPPMGHFWRVGQPHAYFTADDTLVTIYLARGDDDRSPRRFDAAVFEAGQKVMPQHSARAAHWPVADASRIDRGSRFPPSRL